ncbi:uncharacterized protein LOC129615226 isoform X2 [Condylostylus longicornis]|uniref:uncharacterized protein LOC129615226 isoform X2 n=1 Tax=Condylostylus longicornis TaxID=2530218 RepID=UPI00244DE713|nr:uncharacterized protein LOC129615226 isoform X2 [Condylostylus longicornis]
MYICILFNFSVLNRISAVTKTFYFFGLTCLIIPIIAISGVLLSVLNKVNLIIMSSIYPRYDFSNTKKMRTLIDTKKNAAIFHFLLEINGKYDFQKIKEIYLMNLVEKRNKLGELKFPKLRKRLVTCWWQYAWDSESSKFDINKHIILNPARTFRGRFITEANIQEFISELVTKYIPSDISPWQVIVIPPIATKKETYFILVKVHHLLIADEHDLHVSDLLMVTAPNPIKMFKNVTQPSKFETLIERPKHIPNLWNQIYMSAVNRWNEFIYYYDPLESPDKKQQITCLSQLISILFITVVTIITDFMKGYSKTNNHIKYKFRYLVHLFERETSKRNLTIETIVDSLITTMNPINILKNMIRYTWYFCTAAVLLTPYYIIKESLALKDIIMTGHTDFQETLFGIASIYLPLIYCATKEFIQISLQLLNAPKNSYDELFIFRSNEKNVLHTKTFSGRKVIAFSKSIDLSLFKNKSDILKEKSDIELVLICLSSALKKYLQTFESEFGEAPKFINTTCRSIKKDFFVEKNNKSENVGGVLFLNLPLIEFKSIGDFEIITDLIDRIRKRQGAIYLISVGQIRYDIITRIIPEVLMKILINYFSYNYPITITELHGSSEKIHTLWGQEVEDLLFFRPPQSKTCLSLNIHRFGNKIRLAVMADTHLSPDHAKIVNYFESYMESTIF